MRPAEFPVEAIIEAGQALQAAGRNVTGFALRQKVGGGNPTRLRQVWDEHLASNSVAQAQPVAELRGILPACGRENRLCRAAHRARRQSRPSRPWRASSAFPSLTGSVALAAGLRGPGGPSWPVSGAFPALPHRRGRCGQFRDKSAGSGPRSPDVDT